MEKRKEARETTNPGEQRRASHGKGAVRRRMALQHLPVQVGIVAYLGNVEVWRRSDSGTRPRVGQAALAYHLRDRAVVWDVRLLR